MREAILVYPMLTMVILTAAVLVILFRSRVRAVREGKVNVRYYRLYQNELEPEYAVKPARHFVNLFEAPTLFYAACLAAMVTHQITVLIVVLAWLYVAIRALHAVIHLGSNKLRWRMRAYFSGWFVLIVMWIVLAAGVASSA
jgi:hypothetical protein